MERFHLIAGAVLAGLAVALGAFATHALEGTAVRTDLIETGVRYQFLHALALLVLAARPAGLAPGPAGPFLAVGVLLFSGSLYGLAFGGPRWLGPVTPLGGLSLLVGWSLLAIAGFRHAGTGPRP